MSNDAQLDDVEGRTRPELLTRAAYLAGVAAERERCARIVEQTRHYHHEKQLVRDAAARIRDGATEVKE